MRLWLRRLTVVALAAAAALWIGLELGRWRAVRRGVEAVAPPRPSLLAERASGADYVDAYRVAVAASVDLEAVESAAPFGGELMARSDEEILYAGSAPGLRFLLSLHLDREGGSRLTLGTAVFYDSWVGRLYFVPVGVGHRRLVPIALERLAASLAHGDRDAGGL